MLPIMMTRLDSNDENIRFSQSTKKTNLARYLLIRERNYSLQSRTLLCYKAMPALSQTQRAFFLLTSVLSTLLAAEATFPTSGTIQTLTTGCCRSESTKVAAQQSSPPRQQKEVHHLGEKEREHPCDTDNVLPPYKAISCESAQVAVEQTSWAWPSLPCTHCF